MKDFFLNKYREFMQNVNASLWKQICEAANAFGQKPETIIYNNYILPTWKDFVEAGVSRQYEELHKLGLIASDNCRGSGHITRYHLTRRGIKWINE